MLYKSSIISQMAVDKVQVDDGADESQTINRYHLTYHIMSLISGQLKHDTRASQSSVYKIFM